jgi:hypothetical protein
MKGLTFKESLLEQRREGLPLSRGQRQRRKSWHEHETATPAGPAVTSQRTLRHAQSTNSPLHEALEEGEDGSDRQQQVQGASGWLAGHWEVVSVARSALRHSPKRFTQASQTADVPLPEQAAKTCSPPSLSPSISMYAIHSWSGCRSRSRSHRSCLVPGKTGVKENSQADSKVVGALLGGVQQCKHLCASI